MRILCFEISYVGFGWWSLKQEVIHHLREGNKIVAIKRVREVTGKSLFDSKEYVDKLQRELTRRAG